MTHLADLSPIGLHEGVRVFRCSGCTLDLSQHRSWHQSGRAAFNTEVAQFEKMRPDRIRHVSQHVADFCCSSQCETLAPGTCLLLFKISVVMDAPSPVGEPVVILIRHDRHRFHYFLHNRQKEAGSILRDL
jgi:hypothetical protein